MKRSIIVVCAFLLAVGAACDGSEDDAHEAADEERAEAEQVDEEVEADEEAEADEEQAKDEEGEHDGESELAEDLEAGETGQYGGEFTIEDEPVSLADAIAAAEEDDGPVKVEASVEKVCKKKGCWFSIRDDEVDESVRVRMKDYGFFVPRNTKEGARAVIEGTLEKRIVPQEEAQHYADDEAAGTGEEPEQIEGDQERWEMTITAAQMTQPS